MKIKVKIDCPACDAGTCGDSENYGDCDEGTVTVELPGKNEVCDRCGGAGKHCNPAIDGNGLTREDFDADPDFEESYFRGDYDVTCEQCHGRNVVPVIDYDACTPAQRKLADAADRRAAQHAAWDREDAHTRRMESGGY